MKGELINNVQLNSSKANTVVKADRKHTQAINSFKAEHALILLKVEVQVSLSS